MITYHNGDLLKSGCDIICHQVNLQGVMGGGLARQIANRYPKCEEIYINYINQHKTNNQLIEGSYNIYRVEYKKFICNCFTQNQDFSTNYDWLRDCFSQIKFFTKNIVYLLDKKTKTIGVPFCYGCGIANGDWNKVEQIFKDIFENEKDIDFQIWKLE